MTIQVLDTFTDTDGTDLVDHTPDIDVVGNGWQQFIGDPADFEITGNVLVVKEELDSPRTVAFIDAGVSNFKITGTLVAPGFGADMSVFVRWTDNSNHIEVRFQTISPGRINIVQVFGGSGTFLASVAGATATGAGVTVPFEITVNGNLITARDLNSGAVAQGQMTELQSVTNVGTRDNDSGVDWTLDNFQVETVSPAPGDDVQVEAVLVQQPTAIGTQDIVASELGTVVPKGVLFFWSAAGVPGSGVGPDGNHYDDAAWGMGATDGSVEWATTVQLGDGGPPMLTSRGQSSAEVIRLLDPSGVTTAVVAAAEFAAFIDGGVRINWTSVHSLQFSIIAVFFAGDVDCEVNCGVHPEDRSTANPIFVGFEPDFVLASTIDDGIDPTADRVGLGSWGMQDFANPDNLASQARLYLANPVASDANLGRFDTASISFIGSGQTVGTLWRYGDAPPDEMNLELVQGFDSSELVFYMAVRCGGVQVKVGNIISPQAAGLWKVDDPNFEPQFVLLMLGNQPTLGVVSDADDQAWGVGLMTDSFEASQTSNLENNQSVAPANSQSYLDDEAVVAITGFDPTNQLYLGSWLAFHSLGWSVKMETIENDPVEEQWGYLAIEASTSQLPPEAVDDNCAPNPWTTDE